MATTEAPPVEERATGSPAPPPPRRGLRDVAANSAIPIALVVLIAFFSILEPSTFFTTANLQIILGSQAVLVMLALAVTVALTANEFDLSVGFVAAFGGVLLALLTGEHGWSAAAAIPFVLVAGIAFGLVNALLVVKIGVNSFIATLGTGTLLSGITVKLADSAILTGMPDLVTEVTTTKLLGVQAIFFFAIALAVILWYLLEHTPIGRWTVFTGAGAEVARLSGLPVERIRAGVLILSAAIATFAGMLQAGLLGSADPNGGASFLLPAFAAAFLGATTFKRGRFNVWGTVLAVYMVIVGIVGLQMTTGATAWIVSVFNGGVLVVAVAGSSLLARSSRDRSST